MGLSPDVMLNMLHHVSVESTIIRAVLHDAFFEHDNGRLKINCLLDSGALNASYVRKSFVDENRELFDKYILPYNGKAKMANEATASIREAVVLPLMLSSAMGQTYCVDVKFLVMDKLSQEAIIGLPVLVGPLLELFVQALKDVSRRLFDRPEEGEQDLGVLIENPWTITDEVAPEDEETPLPCSFSGPLQFLLVSRQEALDEYFSLFDKHIDAGMRDATPIVELLRTLGSEVFVPIKWEGVLGMEPIEFNWKEGMPERMMPRPRPVNPKLLENAKKEMERMLTYFYIPSTSPVASCLVIAPKATPPYIRFCGDYATLVNRYIETGHYPIPRVFHSLEKISRYKKFFDLDLTNSFHQFPLAERTRRLLSIQTPWGQYEPLFLPEGVPPASGILQKFVSEVFSDFEEWTIYIFDNLLVLADDYQDGYAKVRRILERCKERRIVLKFSKSWFGFDSCEFFGYLCSHKKYGLTQKRKDSIMEIPFPTSIKKMQSFLGCALFFSKFVPDYATMAALLNDMTHKDFPWHDKTQWKHDYEKVFTDFKNVLLLSVELYYPDYNFTFILRVDASDYGVGYVLCQDVDGVLRPVAFGSKKFSAQAFVWDTFNKEGFALYWSVKDCEYYLRPTHFVLEGDHRNLAWMETSVVPKVVRWRVYLQGFSFVFNHIPGTKNRVADWQSRLFAVVDTTQAEAEQTETELLTREAMLQKVHGGRSAHMGARRTWMLLNKHFPGHGISYAQVADYILGCGICQKVRLGMSETIVPIVRHLKNPGPRRVVGIDFLSLEPDKYGMVGVYVVRDHFTKLVFIYPAKEQSAVAAATTLFLYSVYFGCFDYLMDDPGSDFTSETIRELNQWFGIHHRVSLTDRHESNGVEGANKDLLRHIRSLLAETRLKDKWSEPTVLAWCMFIMNKFDDAESGLSPYQLTFGSEAMRHFDFPKGPLASSASSKFLKALDEDLATAQKNSSEFQSKLVAKRTESNTAQNVFQAGDFVLHRLPDDKPLPSKLVGRYAGPYVVLYQRKNDVSCRHCALGHVKEFFVADLKLFTGSTEDALRMAMLDADQYIVDRFLAYKGDPSNRLTVEFLVRFADTTEVWLPWSEDLFATVQYEDFVRAVPELFPLLHRVKESKKLIADINKCPMSDIEAGNIIFLDLRYFGADWYESLPLPEKHLKTYVVEALCVKLNRTRLKAEFNCKTLNRKFLANPMFLHQYGRRRQPFGNDIIVTPEMAHLYPALMSTAVTGPSESEFRYLVGQRYVDDEDNGTYEVVRITTLRDRSIVAYVKRIRDPPLTAKMMDSPIHVADVVRMLNASLKPASK